MGAGEVRSLSISTDAPKRYRAMSFVALPANGDGKDREGLFLAIGLVAAEETRGVRAVLKVPRSNATSGSRTDRKSLHVHSIRRFPKLDSSSPSDCLRT